MTEDAKKAAKSEKKLKVLLGGYQVLHVNFKKMQKDLVAALRSS